MKTLFQLLKERRSIQSTIDNVLERFCLEATTGIADGVRVPLFENHAPKELKDQRDDFFSDFRLVDAIIFQPNSLIILCQNRNVMSLRYSLNSHRRKPLNLSISAHPPRNRLMTI